MATKYESWEPAEPTWYFPYNYASITFTPLTSHTLTGVYLLLSSVNEKTANVSIRTTSGGKPTSTEIASGSVQFQTGNDLWYEWIWIPISGAPVLHAGTTYAIVSPTKYWWWKDGYTEGESYYSNDGVNWTLYTNEAGFQEWGDPVEELVVISAAATDITVTTATLNGEIVNLGSENADQRGFDYGTSPGEYDHEVVEEGSFGEGTYDLPVTGLPGGTTIYFRAKAHDGEGWAYGSELYFSTDPVPPTVTTQAATDITKNSATLNGNITNTGGENCDWRGFEWGTAPGVYDHDAGDSGSFGTGAYTKGLADLPNATYIYYRAKAHNSAGWGYGPEQSFQTLGIRVSTQAASDITLFTATLNGTIVAKSANDVTIRGFDWGTEEGVYDHEVIDCGSFEEGAFVMPLAELTPGQAYYFRAKAYDATGTYYGAEQGFVVSPAEMVVWTLNASDVHPTYATLHGTIVSLGGVNADARGFDYGTSSESYEHEVVEEGSFGVGDYSLPITGLTPGVTYYFRAKAHDIWGWHYGAAVAASLETLDATSITSKTAVLNGNIVSVGTYPITMRGFDLGPAPGVYTTSIWDTGSFVAGNYSRYTDMYNVDTRGVVIFFLLANTTYYFRAKVRDALGLHYGAELSFTTDPPVMEVATWGVHDYEGTTATLLGRIVWLGLTNADERGFDYGTNEGSLDQEVTDSGSFGVGVFSLPVTGLEVETKYYFRAKAHDAVGWHYGKTLCMKISTGDVLTVSSTTAVIPFTITEDDDPDGVPDEIEIEWDTESDPDVYAESYTEEGEYPEDVYNRAVGWHPRDTRLQPDTTYYYRINFHDLSGWHYGGEHWFTTAALGQGGRGSPAAPLLAGSFV